MQVANEVNTGDIGWIEPQTAAAIVPVWHHPALLDPGTKRRRVQRPDRVDNRQDADRDGTS